MKKFLLILAMLAFALKLPADETNSLAPLKIGTTEASKYYDREMIVTGKVVQVTIHPKVVFLNLDERYPNSPLTLVIFHGETNKFGELTAYDGKLVEASGKITKYRDKPEIILSSVKQLKVIEINSANGK